MYAVVGATGNTGKAVVDSLIARGARVRVVLRDAGKGEPFVRKGCEVAVASTDDADGLAAALAGVNGAYLLVPPSYDDPDFEGAVARTTAAIAAGAKAAGVPHIVALSSIGAHMTQRNGAIGSLTTFEHALREAGLNRTFLRPSYFMANWNNVAALARDQGILPTTLQPPERPVPMVSTDDIGAAAGALLLEPVDGERIIHFSGPQDYAPTDVAAVYARRIGRPVEVVAPPQATWPKILMEAGLSRTYANALAEMYAGLNDGSIGWQEGVELRRGTTTLEEGLARLP